MTAHRLQTDLKSFEAMQNNAPEMIPSEMASAVNLLVHPAAGMAAASALGFGLASQAFGIWLGALTGASEASQKLFQAFEGVSVENAGKAAGEGGVTRAASTSALRLVKEAAAEVSTQSHQPQAMNKPAAPDDLKAISGIGPKLEAVLNGYGVWTWRQIAAWTDAEIAWVDDTLGFRGRIRRDDWVGQAAALPSGRRVK
ncbi:NADH-quinone oxidoreductase subunit E [Aquamicrobium ahrensii]|uniref:NADH-quinone oxidoreductase subunit E n=2 Tax=Aquamicrobium ahrensii TaxID=469551 RepID=A0ABV2KI13_9HYPH